MNKNSISYTVVFTFLSAFFFVLILSAANAFTAERVFANEKTSVYRGYLRAAGIEVKDRQEAAELFQEYFPGVEYPDIPEIVKAEVRGEEIVLTGISGNGVWGTIQGVIAVKSDLSRIAGLEIITHNETPGLGGRIDEEWFKNQFSGMKIPDEGLRVRKGRGTPVTDMESGEIDGITGATGTSNSIERIVNSRIFELREGGIGQ